MKNVLSPILCVAVLAATGWARIVVYSDNTNPLTYEWLKNTSSATEVTCPVPYEGTQCMDYTFDMGQGTVEMNIGSPVFGPSKQVNGSIYKYLQFAARITDTTATSSTVSFWCIHCDASKSKDLYFNGKASFQPTSSWKVFSIPMSTFANDPSNMISTILLDFYGGKGTGDFYLDDVQFTNTLPATGVQEARRSLEIPAGASLKVDVYSLKGDLVDSRVLGSEMSFARSTSQVAKNLRPGTYVVRQSLLEGATISRWGEDRMMVVPR